MIDKNRVDERDDEDEDEFDLEAEKPQKDDKRLRDDDEEDGDASEGAADEESASDDEGREKIRERRREEKRRRRQRAVAERERDKQVIEGLYRQVSDMEARFAQLQGRAIQQDARDLDARLNYEENRFRQAEAAIRDATERNDGAKLTNALRVRDEAIHRHRELTSVKQRVMTQPAQQQAPQPLDPRLANHARDFMEEHAWYSPQASDDDSAVITALDNKIAAEGFDPTSEAYWQELRKRASKVLPHRFAAASGGRRGPPTANSQGVSPGSRKEFSISAERRAAMEEAGMWDDPVKRDRMIKQYARYDRENQSR
jgi:hypothetical protein